MVICVDAGNTDIDFGVFSDGKITARFRAGYRRDWRTRDFEGALSEGFSGCGKDPAEATGCVLCSVVRRINENLMKALENLTGIKPLFFSNDRSGLKILTDDPMEVGADITAACLAAVNTGRLPAVVTDLGTATTVTAVDWEGSVLGVSILPGVVTGRRALERATGLAFDRKLSPTGAAIGKNTRQSLSSGIILGRAGSIDRLAREFEREMGRKATVFMTGGVSAAIAPFCACRPVCDPDLLLKGLYAYYMKNSQDA